ncbi:MAG: family 10 glycosylhydrolase [Bacteroidota bacterium]
MRFTKSCLLSLIVCLILISDLQAQSINYSALQAPKRELRAAWIATVLNIDYPRTPTTNPIALKEQYRNLLDELEKLGMNAVIVQVRPAADALYPSEFAPWSAYLTGRQGAPPKEDFDPLEFMIKETHQRSMEFHAWINPYRASMNMDTSALFLTHPVNQHPDWLVAYEGKMYFNPGIPAVRDHLLDVVGELVDNYNMDGIHIDDYFYPYPAKDKPFPDSLTFKFYGQPYKDINEWRRHNTDLLVESMYELIKSNRPSIQFGVSPFGVWRNKSQDPKGSDTRAGVTSYDDLHADVLKWMNSGWVDYIMPQLYWSIGYEPADHEVLVRWWSGKARDLPLYIGHSVYKVGDNADTTWNDPGEIPRQIDLNRRNFQTQGSAFFSARSFRNNPLRIKDSLRAYYQTEALWPERPELELPKLGPVDLRKPRWKEEAVRLRWKPNVSIAGIKERAHYYVVYRFTGEGVGDLDNPANILAITPIQDEEEKRIEYFDKTTRVGETYTYVVTTANRAHIESKASNSRGIFQKNENRIRRSKPVKVRKGRERTRRVRRRDLRG